MRALVFTIVGFTLTILWFLFESMIGWHDETLTFGSEVAWFCIPIITTLGSMIVGRTSSDGPYRYIQAVRTGLLAAVFGGVGVGLAWLLYIVVLDPSYLGMMVEHRRQAAVAQGLTEGQVRTVVAATVTVMTVPISSLTAVVAAILSGSGFAALGALLFHIFPKKTLDQGVSD
ncbi:MAG TPA: DUF4199 family protein [Chlorobiota bacterium]|nr:DUF4199 family protein [Chlorobiota bacterium]